MISGNSSLIPTVEDGQRKNEATNKANNAKSSTKIYVTICLRSFAGNYSWKITGHGNGRSCYYSGLSFSMIPRSTVQLTVLVAFSLLSYIHHEGIMRSTRSENNPVIALLCTFVRIHTQLGETSVRKDEDLLMATSSQEKPCVHKLCHA